MDWSLRVVLACYYILISTLITLLYVASWTCSVGLTASKRMQFQWKGIVPPKDSESFENKRNTLIFFKVCYKIAKKLWCFWFSANFHKFQIHVQQSFFCLIETFWYGKTFIFYKKYVQIKIKWFAQLLRDLIKKENV